MSLFLNFISPYFPHYYKEFFWLELPKQLCESENNWRLQQISAIAAIEEKTHADSLQ